MGSTLGMTLAVLLIIGCAAGGVWYWMKIKETPKTDSQPNQSGILGTRKEPVINTAVNRGAEDNKPEKSDPKEQTGANVQSVAPSETTQKVEAAPTSTEKAGSSAGNVKQQVQEPVAKPSAYNYEKTAKAIREEQKKKQEKLNPASTPFVNPLPFQSRNLPIEEALRFENLQDGQIPSHNPFLEVAIRENFKNPVTGTDLLQELQPMSSLEPHGNYKVYALDESTRRWEKPEASGLYSSLVFFVQLAGINGVANEEMISSFLQLKERIEMAFDGSSDEVEQPTIVAKSKQLAGMLKDFGVQITLYLRCRQEVTTDQFEKIASDLGFKRLTSRSYEKLGELIQTSDGKLSKNLKGAISVSWITPNYVSISLFVALMPPEAQPLKALLMAANAFAGPLDAEIVDGQGYPIDGTILTTVKKEVEKFYERMRASGLEPGSEVAHKLLT